MGHDDQVVRRRIRRRNLDVDSTIMHLDGRPRQRLISYDNDLKPMNLHWGDRFRYFAYRERGQLLPGEYPPGSITLELRGGGKTVQLPLRIDPYAEQEIRIPGSSPEPMEAYLLNTSDNYGELALKITIYSSDRERGRETFRVALMNTSLNSAARRLYLQVAKDGARLRNASGQNSAILRTVREGTYVKVSNRTAEWCEVRLPEGRTGWMKCSFLKEIAPSAESAR